MQSTIDVLRAESKRLRTLAMKIDALIDDMDVPSKKDSNTPDLPGLDQKQIPQSKNQAGEFAGMTQRAAILKALESGPQTTRELFVRLNAGGQSFRNTTYVSSVIARMNGELRRTPAGRNALRNHPATDAAANTVKPTQ